MPPPTSRASAARSRRSSATSAIGPRSSGPSSRVAHDRGRIDVLVNNAGIIQVGPLEHMTVADFEDAMATHFWGPLYTILAALPHMRERGAKRIVNISSIGGKIAVPHLLPYSASKFALTGLSEGLRSELAAEGLRRDHGLSRADAHRVDLQRPVQGPAPPASSPGSTSRTPCPACRCRRAARPGRSSTPAGTATPS